MTTQMHSCSKGLLRLAIFVRLVVHAACAANSVSPQAMATNPPAHEVRFNHLLSGFNSRFLIPAFFVAQTDDDFLRIWKLHLGATPKSSEAMPPPPDVDFGEYFVVAFFGGSGSTWDSYQVIRVVEFPDKFHVEIIHTLDNEQCPRVRLPGAPFDFVRFQNTYPSKPIDYTLESRLAECRR
jgi:hypothetical protein